MSDAIGTLHDYKVVRWRQLAERRLEHINELFESGRWSRYFGEDEFLEIIKQTTQAVETWRRLAPTEPDTRLPASPFAIDEAVEARFDQESDEADAEASVLADQVESIMLAYKDEERIEPSAADFDLESALAMIALQRVQEAATTAIDQADAA